MENILVQTASGEAGGTDRRPHAYKVGCFVGITTLCVNVKWQGSNNEPKVCIVIVQVTPAAAPICSSTAWSQAQKCHFWWMMLYLLHVTTFTPSVGLHCPCG